MQSCAFLCESRASRGKAAGLYYASIERKGAIQPCLGVRAAAAHPKTGPSRRMLVLTSLSQELAYGRGGKAAAWRCLKLL